MKKLFAISQIFIFVILINGCNHDNMRNKYYIISRQDSINNELLNRNIDSILPPPPPPLPQYLKWYSNIVFIMDSTDRVYIYQTERKHIEVRINIGNSNSPDYITYDGNEINEDSVIYDFNFPNYIGLKPEFLLAFASKDLLSFIKLNKDIFQLDTSNSEKMMLFYIASNQDTVKNEAFYDLTKYITKSRNQINTIHYFVRNTTEEENSVIKYKRKNTEFKPDTINWTEKFLDGRSSPFSNHYKRTELKAYSLIRAKETIKKNSMVTRPIN
jgi:hypothetical protein